MRGGYRAGAGRPPGGNALSKNAASGGGTNEISPLAFLLEIIGDDSQTIETRMRAAGLALPYTHRKVEPPTKRQRASQSALEAERGTAWEGLLNPPLA